MDCVTVMLGRLSFREKRLQESIMDSVLPLTQYVNSVWDIPVMFRLHWVTEEITHRIH